MAGMIGGARFNTDRMAIAAGDFATATDFADYLVTKGVPFRSAHETIGKIVKWCLDENKCLSDLTLAEFQQFDSRFEPDCLKPADPVVSADSRNSPGGTGGASIAAQIAKAKTDIAESRRWVEGR
jgi:argininosuccinate lyase